MSVDSESVVFRSALLTDLPDLVQLLANDPLGATRESTQSPPHPAYSAAFRAIDADPNNEILVAVLDDRIAAMLQITYTQYLTHTGSRRATIEGVRVLRQFRGQGMGRLMLQHAIECARARGCSIVQLTTDKTRPEAIRFYRQLGFAVSHEGMKLKLASD
jgi:ribosomal protein S18 acetylase RimI-like enzyme